MKKIMFNDKYGLTKAVLEGRKTMARGIVRDRMTEDDITAYLKGHTEVALETSPYKIGEVVAVAQSYKSIHEEMMDGDYGNSIYDNFRGAMVSDTAGWNNKIFVRADLMPHRIRITDIKVERLQDISCEDCYEEGIMQSFEAFYYSKDQHFNTPKEAFADLVDKVSGKGTWEANLWVFAYSFELVGEGGTE